MGRACFIFMFANAPRPRQVRGSNFGCGWKNRRSYCVLIERVGHQPPKLQNGETSDLFYRLFVAFRFKFTLSLAFAF